MSNYHNSNNYQGSPMRYNPKVAERMSHANSDWAELSRAQQQAAQQMIQYERDLRNQQKVDLRNDLSMMMDEKNVQRSMELQTKRQALNASNIAIQDYQKYVADSKDAKNNFQRYMADEYDHQRVQREEYERQQNTQRRQVEGKIVHNALDSLEKERLMNEQKKRDYNHAMELMMQERELRKQMENQQAEQYKQEHNRLLEENAKNLTQKEINYVNYYQKVGQNQHLKQQIYDVTAGQQDRARAGHKDNFIHKNYEEGQRKLAEEEARRKREREEFTRAVNNVNIAQRQEHEYKHNLDKAAYQRGIDEQTKRIQDIKEYEQMMRTVRTNEKNDYKNILQTQMKEYEEVKRKNEADMLDHEKKILLDGFTGFVPGIKSSKVDALINPHIKTSLNFGMTKSTSTTSSPVVAPEKRPVQSYYINDTFSSGSMSPVSPMTTSNATTVTGSSPMNYRPERESYNPITNPVAKNNQNPYIVKDFQRGGYIPRNTFAVLADKSLVRSSIN